MLQILLARLQSQAYLELCMGYFIDMKAFPYQLQNLMLANTASSNQGFGSTQIALLSLVRILPSALQGKASERAVKGTKSTSVSTYNRDVLETPKSISLPNSD